MQEFSLREFALADYDAVAAVWEQAGLRQRPSDALPEVAKKLERDPDLFLVAQCDGQIIGAVMGAWDGRRGWVHHLAVHPHWQRRGVGSALVSELERRLQSKGCLKLNLLVYHDNRQVVEFYQKLGYRVEPTIEMGKEL